MLEIWTPNPLLQQLTDKNKRIKMWRMLEHGLDDFMLCKTNFGKKHNVQKMNVNKTQTHS